MNIYEWADNSINASPRYATGFTQLLASNPFHVSASVRQCYDARHLRIGAFQKTALDIFRAALNRELDPVILHWLLNETPESLGATYHRRLEDRHFTLPVFYRTDELRPGLIAEIQCPGSAWGDLQLVSDCAAQMGFRGSEASPAEQFAVQLTDYLGAAPVVHHLQDNASAPPGVRYFIEKTRPAVKYWGIDAGVKARDCNFIRSHSFFGLCAHYDFSWWLSKMGESVAVDLPPHVLFDQKAPLALPFWSVTRAWFSDEIREMFPFTTPLLPAGIELPDGARVAVEAFSRLPKSRRAYYAKYAGSDVALNWGSRAVYRLSSMGSDACLDFLRRCLSGYERGEIWLLQRAESQNDEITFTARDGTIHTRSLRAKFSGYYGPGGCLGVLAFHRHQNKVHGQPDTVLSYVLDGAVDVTV